MGSYIGVNETPKKINKWYVGVDNTAKLALKGYVGVDGVARPFLESDKELTYYGTTTDLSLARYSLAATTVGNYALFGGGYIDYHSYATAVDTYDTNLVKGTATSLSKARYGLAATTINDYALFGGGDHYNSSTGSAYATAVDTYDTNLVKGTATSLSYGRVDLAATTIGNYALFGGGYGRQTSSSTAALTGTVDTYDTNLVKGTATSLSISRRHLSATTVGNYALFGGGRGSGSNSSTVDTYDTNLVKGTATSLSKARSELVATTVGNYALFAGGHDYGSYSSAYAIVDTYDTNLVKGTATSLSKARYGLAATTINDYALFGGGFDDDNSSNVKYYTTVDIYDNNLVKNIATDLSVERRHLSATTVGNYALFSGGYVSGSKSSTVDVYTLI